MSSFGWKCLLFAIILFGISFGYVEAAVVDYLRALYDPVRQHLYPGCSSDDLFPLVTLEPEHVRFLGVEVVRELATLATLARSRSRSPGTRGSGWQLSRSRSAPGTCPSMSF